MVWYDRTSVYLLIYDRDVHRSTFSQTFNKNKIQTKKNNNNKNKKKERQVKFIDNRISQTDPEHIKRINAMPLMNVQAMSRWESTFCFSCFETNNTMFTTS